MKLVNLLPKAKQRELRAERLYRSCKVFFVISVLSYAAVMAGQYAARVYIQFAERQLAGRIGEVTQQVSKQKNASVKARIKQLNDLVTDYQNLSAAAPRWSNVLKAFAPLPPEDVDIYSFTADSAKKVVTITGYSPKRELVLELYDRLKADTAHFTNVDYPFENVAKPTDVSFHFSFTIRDELLR